MAKAIALVPASAQSPPGPPAPRSKADPTLRAQAELRKRLDEAPAENAEALLALWKLLDAAHQHHVLDIATGAIASSNDIITRLADAGSSEAAIRAIRNALLLSELLGSLDPNALHALVKNLPPAVARFSGPISAEFAAATATQSSTATSASPNSAAQSPEADKPPSLWQLFRRFTSADSRRALSLLAGLTTAIGRTLAPPTDAPKK
jgi:uncharacterized protein YjgD (DUF1641 family)